MPGSFTFINKTKSNSSADGLLFESIKNKALGKNYELELVFVSPKESAMLNKKYHKKEGPANILSFSLDKASGQIFICPSFAKKEALKFGREFKNYIAFLFIHGVIHLKGFVHGAKMDSEEEKFRSLFSI